MRNGPGRTIGCICGVLLTAAMATGLAGLAACSPAGVSEANAETSALTIRDSDYREDRNKFKTKLVHVGPSPQQGPVLKLPTGVEEIEFPSGALRLKAWIDYPAERKSRMPVVVFLHGGFAFGADDFEMARPYLDAGFVVVTPILRGENGQAGAYSMFYDEVDDVVAVAEFLRTRPDVDPDRIYLAGHSVGGTMALLTAMATPRFRAVASFSGSPDQYDFIQSGWGRIAPFDLSNLREYELRSPLSYAKSLKAPTRVFYGSEESLFRPASKRLAEIASGAGLDVESREFAGDHFSAVPAEIAASIEFFRKEA